MTSTSAAGTTRRGEPRRTTGHTWGTLHVGHGGQWVKHQLVIHPPGITDTQRTALRIRDTAPVWAPASWLVVWAVAAGIGVPPMIALTGAALLVIPALVWSARAASRTRRQVRHLTVWTGPGEDLCAERRRARLRDIADELRRADVDLRAGRISPVDHEIIWARGYDRLG